MFLDWLLRRKPPVAEAVPAKHARRRVRPNVRTMLEAMASATPPRVKHATYQPIEGVVPAGKQTAVLAMDDMPYNSVFAMNGTGLYGTFLGYPILAELAQLPEYRKMVGTLADEMTRKWIKLVSTGDTDQSQRIKDLSAALTKFQVRERFREATEHDGFFGRGQIFIRIKKPGGGSATNDLREMKLPLLIDARKIAKDSLEGFTVVEPMWTYPALYNSTDPLAPTFYRPDAWFVMGKTIHQSRFLMLTARPVPDMLKAVYSFGGVSLSQLAMPYVNNWLRTRDSVSDLVHSFSTSGLATNMQAELSDGDSGAFGIDVAGCGNVVDRAKLFNLLRDNRGMMILDKESEEFFQFNTPLGGLDALQAQSQEQMAAVSSIPLVKLLGITPAGLNANSDGEIRVFYDYIHSQQEKVFRDPLKKLIDIVQLSEFGNIDPDITFIFEPLYQLSDLEKSAVRKADADADSVLVQAAIIAPDDARQRLIDDPESPYHGMDMSEPDLDLEADSSEEEGEGQESEDTHGSKGA